MVFIFKYVQIVVFVIWQAGVLTGTARQRSCFSALISVILRHFCKENTQANKLIALPVPEIACAVLSKHCKLWINFIFRKKETFIQKWKAFIILENTMNSSMPKLYAQLVYWKNYLLLNSSEQAFWLEWGINIWVSLSRECC